MIACCDIPRANSADYGGGKATVKAGRRPVAAILLFNDFFTTAVLHSSGMSRHTGYALAFSEERLMRQRGVMAALLAAVLLTGVGVTLAAQDAHQGPPPFGRGRGPGGPGGPMGGPGFGLPGMRDLDLTDAQKDQIEAIVESHRAEMQQVGEKTRSAQVAIDAAAEGATIDEAAIHARSTELAAAIADGAILRARVNAEIFNILTAEQQQKVQERRAQIQQRMKEGPRRQRGQERDIAIL